jgi:hypothetical protein
VATKMACLGANPGHATVREHLVVMPEAIP